MKKIIQISCVLLSVILLSTACDDETVWGDCIDESLINSNPNNPVVCTGHYEPVCGCDGQTYNNQCEATYWNGVLRWVPGECP